MMHSITVWNFARRPNYVTNFDKKYPYSEVPYIGNYHLVKIPDEDLLGHVDYWGEGRIVAPEGTSGFVDCYNVNHQYQLVSNGPDRDKKIPNRIPVISYTNCDTSSYIKDNSVKLVTLMGAPINKSCAQDIARMVNSDVGRVVVLGFSENAADIKNLDKALYAKNLMVCYEYELQDNLKGLTLYDTSRAYLNLTQFKEQLINNINAKKYDNAVNITKTLESNDKGDMIKQIIINALKEPKASVIGYADKLWHSDAKNIAIMGDSKDKSSKKVEWKLTPVWDKNEIYFTIRNVEHDIILKLDPEENKDNKIVKGDKVTEINKMETKFQWCLEPVKIDDDILFYIINREFKQGLKLDDKVNPSGDQLLLGEVGLFEEHSEDFGWFIAPFE